MDANSLLRALGDDDGDGDGDRAEDNHNYHSASGPTRATGGASRLKKRNQSSARLPSGRFGKRQPTSPSRSPPPTDNKAIVPATPPKRMMSSSLSPTSTFPASDREKSMPPPAWTKRSDSGLAPSPKRQKTSSPIADFPEPTTKPAPSSAEPRRSFRRASTSSAPAQPRSTAILRPDYSDLSEDDDKADATSPKEDGLASQSTPTRTVTGAPIQIHTNITKAAISAGTHGATSLKKTRSMPWATTMSAHAPTTATPQCKGITKPIRSAGPGMIMDSQKDKSILDTIARMQHHLDGWQKSTARSNVSAAHRRALVKAFKASFGNRYKGRSTGSERQAYIALWVKLAGRHNHLLDLYEEDDSLRIEIKPHWLNAV